MTDVIVYSVLNVLTLTGIILLFANSNPDYYEDVLQVTESTFELKKSIKEGRSFRNRPTKIEKVRDTGINQGWGANTFFYKHLRQMMRRDRIPFVGTSTFVMVAVVLIMAVIMRSISGDGDDQMPAGMVMAIALSTTCYIQFFFSAAGDWAQELMKPYIYLVPESSFKKLLWASMTTIMKPVVDGVIIFMVLGIFVHANPATVILCMLLFPATSFVFTAGNILSQRIFGQVSNKGILMFAYILVLMVLLAPGITVSALLYAFAGNLPGIVIGMPIFVWNIAVSLGIFAACRNILSTAELNN